MKNDPIDIKKRKETKRVEKKQVILDAAEKIMQASGLNSLNIDLVAKETSFAKGTIYLYFRSKEEILASLTLKSRNLLLDYFRKAAEKVDNELLQIEAVIWANFYFAKKHKLYYELLSFYESNLDLEETKELKEISVKISSYVVTILLNGKKNCLIREDLEHYQFSLSLWGMNVGMIQLINSKADIIKFNLKITDETLYANFCEVVINGIKAVQSSLNG